MSLHTEFDKGSLLWVKNEIDESFARTQDALQLFASSGEETALRHAQTYLHQACGALILVDLPGVARFCEEIELAIAGIGKLTISREQIPALVQAIDTARIYLERLLAGIPNQPLRLLAAYREIAELNGNKPSGADLFFPQLQLSLPSGLPQKTLQPEEAEAFMRQQRSRFESGLLRWLQGQPNAAQVMAASLSDVAAHQSNAMARAFWWAAAGLALGVSGLKPPIDEELRQLLMRLNLQMRRLADGSGKVAERLFRDILYRLAQLDGEKSVLVKRLQQSFELAELFPSPETLPTGIEQQGLKLAHTLREHVQSLKDAWSRIAIGQTDKLEPAREQLASLLFQAQQLESPPLQKLLKGLEQQLGLHGHAAPEESWALEFATGLLLVDNGLAAYPEHPDDYAAQVDIQLLRLEAPETSPALPQLDHISREAQERLLNAQLAQEIRTNLRLVEELLDGFFRTPANREQLKGIYAPLHQVQGALQMLDQPQAVQLLQACQARAESYLTGAEIVPDELEQLAEALSSLGFYVDGLEQGHRNDVMLAPVLAKLCGSSVALDTEEAPVEILENEPEQAEPGKNASPAPAPVEEAPEPKPLPTSEAAIDAELLDVYLEEATEVLATIAAQIAACRSSLNDREALTVIRRSFHTLKGSGRMVGLFELGEIAWSMEQVMNKLLQLEKPASVTLLQLIEEAHGAFSGWIESLRHSGHADVSGCDIPLRAQALRDGMDKEEETPAPSLPPAQPEPQPAPDLAPAPEDITIGPVTVSPTLFAIFQEESARHLNALQHGITQLAEQKIPGPEFLLAAHTLGGILSTTGFRAQGELAYALEQALQQLGSDAVNELPVLKEAVAALESMLASIRAHEPPAAAVDLVDKLGTRKGVSTLPEQTEQEEGAQELAALPAGHEDDILSIFFSAEEDEQEVEDDEEDEILTELLESIYAPEETVSAESGTAEKSAEPFEPETCHAALEALALQPPAEETVTEPQANDYPLQTGAEPVFRSLEAWREEINSAHSDDIDEQLLPVFLEEADELMPAIGAQLHALSQGDGGEALSRLRRELHTLKGSARMAGAMRMGEAAHRLETLLEGISRVNDTLLAQLDNGNELLHLFLSELRAPAAPALPVPTETASQTPAAVPVQRNLLLGETEGRTTIRVRAELVEQLVNLAGEVAISRSRIEAEMHSLKGSLTDLTENVTRLRGQLRELEIQAESQMQARTREMQAQDSTFDPLEFDRFTRLQELTRFIAESVNDIGNVQQSLLKNFDESDAALTAQARMTRDLQQNLMRVRLVPLSSLSERLYRLARTAGKETGKRVNLDIRGASVEIDRGVLEQMVSPLEHMLRNAIAHGIETPANREAAGKPELGEILLEARQEGNELVLVLKDDGSGLDLNAIRAKGIEKGLIKHDQALSEHDTAMLIFEPGFSTADNITQLSGRGIGMDVVRNEISNLGGRIDLATQLGQGTTFIIRLPLTLAVTQVLLVRAGERMFALPSVLVEQVQELKHDALASLYTRQEQEWQGQRYPLAYLPRLLGDFAHQPEQKRFSTVLLLRSGTDRVALHIDELVKNQEVVVKPIGPQLARIPGVVGGTVLGSGEIVLIMNPLLLLPLAGQIAATLEPQTANQLQTAPRQETLQTAPVVMVVDDSLTVRKITGRLLAREGYQVITAKDGVDAMQQLQDIKPAVMLVDIEMPRMDGFELTRNIRATPETREIPIIMITSRTAEKHRKVAFDLGVNVFLGKPYQEDELLEHVRQLSDSRH